MAANNMKVSSCIHDDVAFTILSKLPLKSLKRFSCVCQSWSSLFENPYFITMFHKIFLSEHRTLYDDTCLLLKQRVNELHLLSEGERNIILKSPLYIVHEVYLDIFGYSVNGLFCLHDMFERTFVLWNPATKACKYIPLNIVGFKQEKDTASMSFVHGFGYDCVGDDYKVICLIEFLHRDLYDSELPNFLWEIYSLKSNSWRKLDLIMPNSTNLRGSNVYLNGVCHWCGKTNPEKSVVSFNLSKEVFLTTPFASYMYESFVDYLVVLNDSIAMITHCKKTSHFHISILGEVGIKESWVKLFTIESLSGIYHPIGVGKKGDVFFRNEDGELFCFDLSTGMIEKKDIEENGMLRDPKRFELLIYKENLLALGSN